MVVVWLPEGITDQVADRAPHDDDLVAVENRIQFSTAFPDALELTGWVLVRLGSHM